MLLDDAIAIECEYPSINQGETGKRWRRIKTALAELGTTTNTGSPKSFDEMDWYLVACKVGITPEQAESLYRWLVKKLRVGA